MERIIKNPERQKQIAKDMADKESALIAEIASKFKLTMDGEWDSPIIQRFKEEKLPIPSVIPGAWLLAKWQPLLAKTPYNEASKIRLAYILEVESTMLHQYISKARTVEEAWKILGTTLNYYFKGILKAAET